MVLVLHTSHHWDIEACLSDFYRFIMESQVWLYYILCLVLRYLFVRYQLIKWKIRRYFKKSENDRHIEHYIEHCSLGDWLVLYQMSRNMNKRFFADFISVLSKTVNPHSADQCHEHHHFIKDTTLDKVETFLLKPLSLLNLLILGCYSWGTEKG